MLKQIAKTKKKKTRTHTHKMHQIEFILFSSDLGYSSYIIVYVYIYNYILNNSSVMYDQNKP